MPSKSPAQARLMQAAAHDPAFAEKAGVPQKVASKFVSADQGPKIADAIRKVKPKPNPANPATPPDAPDDNPGVMT